MQLSVTLKSRLTNSCLTHFTYIELTDKSSFHIQFMCIQLTAV